MTYDHEGGVAVQSRIRPGTPEQVDRMLVIACVALWLAALGAAVAAVVALVDLASSPSAAAGESTSTPWLLYSVIGVSAAVIIGAIPLLLRARQTASSGPAPRPASHDDAGQTGDMRSVAQRLQPFGAPVLRRHSTPPAGSRVGFPTAAVEQIWLRCTTIIAGAMGAAVMGIGVATYLMASADDTAAWLVYGLAGLITVAMPAAPWFFMRELRELLGAS